MKNIDIRELADKKNVRLWEIADRLGIADCNFSRMLRKELPVERKRYIYSIIYCIAKEKHNEQ